jgi:diacylglycerol kinase (ATP)
MTDAVLPVQPFTATAPPEVPAPAADALRWLAIRNPAAGRAGNTSTWQKFERALRRAGLHLDVVTTSAPGEGAELAEHAARGGVGRILVAGGDGTVHEVVNGLMQARRDGRLAQVPVLAPLALGTGNDWARSLGLPRDPDRLAAIVARGTARPHDVGVIRFADGAVRWFVNVAGAGFDAHVIARLPTLAPSKFAYLGGALRELARYRSPRFCITCDDALLSEGRFLLAFVANGRFCGHRMHVAPTASLDDGLFDVVTIDDVGLLRALPKLVKLYRGDILHDPVVRHASARRVRIESSPTTAVEADGQLVGVTPAEFQVEPGALNVLRAA